ncbi:MAG: ComF family protein [Vulcanimicrobiaceae bacterium]
MISAVLDLLFPARCAVCARIGSGLCVACAPVLPARTLRSATLQVSALGAYEAPWRSAVLALKDGRRDVAAALGRRLSGLLPESVGLVPVPTTAARRRRRGFDGALLLAQIVAARTGGSVYPVLSQVAGDAQRGRSRSARLKARGRFHCAQSVPPGARLMLVDDVMTTGATLEDCAAALRRAGAQVDRAIVVAATPWERIRTLVTPTVTMI